MDYRQRYIKYKTKYLMLKADIEGGTPIKAQWGLTGNKVSGTGLYSIDEQTGQALASVILHFNNLGSIDPITSDDFMKWAKQADADNSNTITQDEFANFFTNQMKTSPKVLEKIPVVGISLVLLQNNLLNMGTATSGKRTGTYWAGTEIEEHYMNFFKNVFSLLDNVSRKPNKVLEKDDFDAFIEKCKKMDSSKTRCSRVAFPVTLSAQKFKF